MTQTLQDGESLKLLVQSHSEKSGFINITYHDNSTKKTDENKVLFYVWNEKRPDKPFEMSYLDSVLLPNSPDNFVVWLGAQGGPFTFDVLASNAVQTLASIMALFMVGIMTV